MSQVINQAKEALEARLRELKPFIEEEAQIRRLLAVMREAEVDGLDESGSYERPRISGEARKHQILSLLHDHDGPMRSKDIAQALVITPGRVSQLVSRLTEQGFVEKASTGIEITSTGKEELSPVKLTVGRPQIVEVDDE